MEKSLMTLNLNHGTKMKGPAHCRMLPSRPWVRYTHTQILNSKHKPYTKRSFIKPGKKTRWSNLNGAEIATNVLASINFKRKKGEVCVGKARMCW